MSEDRYRLTPVRNQRERDEHVKRGDLAAAVGDARAGAASVAEAAARVTAARVALATARSSRSSITANAAVVAERFIARKRRDLETALEAHLRAEAAHRGQVASLDAARGRLAIARAEREVIERHFAHWRTERRKLAERRED